MERRQRDDERAQREMERVKLNAGLQLGGVNIKNRQYEQRVESCERGTDAPKRQNLTYNNNIRNQQRSENRDP